MFTSSPNTQTAILPLAETLFADFVSFGRLAGHYRLTKQAMARYLDRAKFVVEFLTVLTARIDLRFADASRFPYVSNTKQWAEEAPSAGYTGTSNDPMPSDVAYTLFVGWLAHNENEYPNHRPLRAALQLLHDHDIETALQFVIELQVHGYIPDSAVVDEILTLLCVGRAATETDSELLSRLIPTIATFRDPKDWIDSDIETSWLDDSSQYFWRGPQSAPLLELALDAVAKLRDSRSLDDWLARQIIAGTTIWGVMNLIDRPALSLGIRTVLSQLDEIRCDTGSFLYLARDVPITDTIVALDEVANAMLATAPPMGAHRLERQRALRPSCLAGVNFKSYSSLPMCWRHLSWRAICSFAAHAPHDESQIELEWTAYPTSSNTPESIQRDIDTIRSLVPSRDHHAAIAVLRPCLLRYPWSSVVRLELAIRLDETGSHKEACDLLVEALTLEPSDPLLWQSLTVVLNNCSAADEADFADDMRRATEAMHDSSEWPSGTVDGRR
jgi:hypothetical protein